MVILQEAEFYWMVRIRRFDRLRARRWARNEKRATIS